MKVCPTCGRNLNKTMHNWSEIIAGLALLWIVIPIVNFIANYDKWTAINIMIGVVILYIVCFLHLYAEVRMR
jgi:hypothetical protein